MITKEKLQEILHYNPETGIFIWLQKHHTNSVIGEMAGCKNNHGYIYIWLEGKSYLAHRLAWLYMTGNWPLMQIDHINRIRHDNWFKNLRDVPPIVNSQNSFKPRMNKSTGIPGVYFNKKANRYSAQARINGRQINVGSFATLEEAISAREKVLNQYL